MVVVVSPGIPPSGDPSRLPKNPTGQVPSDAATEALARADATYGAAAGVGVSLPDLTPGGGSCGDGGPCSAWMNLEGNLSVQTGPPRTGGLGPDAKLTYNSAGAATTRGFGKRWVFSHDRRISVSGGTTTIIDGIGSEYDYTVTPSIGGYYLPPDGATNSLQRLATGFQEIEPGGTKYNYDSSGNLTSVESLPGTWTITRSGSDLTKITDPAGGVMTLTYASSKLTKITDSAGRPTLYSIDGSDNLTKITSPELCITSLGYDGSNRITSVDTPAGVKTTYGYDSSGRLTKIQTPSNYVTTLMYPTDDTLQIVSARPTGRVGQWTLHADTVNPAITIAYDSSGQGNVGTIVGNPTLATGPDGTSNSALSFVGADAIVLGQPSVLDLLPTEEFTICVWLKTFGSNDSVFAKRGASADERQFDMYVSSGGSLGGMVGGTGLSSGVSVNDGKWYHAALRNYDDGGTMRCQLYIDGVAQGSSRTTGTKTSTLDIVLAARRNVDNTDLTKYFQGDLSDARMYNRALSVAEIAAIADNRPSTSLTNYTRVASSSQLQSLKNPLGEVTTYTWDDNGWPATITDPRGNITTFGYDTMTLTANAGLHRLKTVQSPTGGIFTYLLDASDELETLIDQRGNRSTLTWDAGQPTLSEFENALGKVTSYTYTGGYKQLESIENPLGKTWTLAYDADGLQESDKNPLGEVTTYTYNDNEMRQTVENAEGEISTTVYDDVNRVTEQINPLGDTTTLMYEIGTCRLTDETNPLGKVTTYAYDAEGLQNAVTNPLGFITTTTYDELGRVQTVKDPLGNVSTLSYDAANRNLSSENPLGKITTFGYDAAGNQTSVKNPLGEVSTTVYDGDNQVQSTQDALGNVTTLTYDLAGNQTTAENPLGKITTSTYTELNQSKTSKNPLGKIWTTTYDDAGNVASEINPLGNTTNYNYNAANQRTATQNPLGKVTQFSYDLAGRQETVTNPLGKVSTTVYDDAGRVEATINPEGEKTTLTYYDDGQQKAIENPLGFRSTTTYDDAGRVESVTDAENHVTTTLYDSAGRVETQINALGKRTTLTYYPDGQPKAIQNARGFRTTQTYDDAGRVETIKDPLGGVTTLGYDVAGRNTSRTDPRNITATFDYDDDGRLTTRQYTNDPTVTFTYDDADNRKTMTDGIGTTSYTYDAVDRPTTTENPDGKIVILGYDAAGQRDKMTDPDGGVFTYQYDDAGQLDYLINPDDDRTTYTYDANGRVTKKELANGTIASSTYDVGGRLKLLENLKSNDSTISSFSYTYDKVGHRKQLLQSTGSTVAWTYDAAYRLTNSTRTDSDPAVAYNETMTYDAVGNRLTKFDSSGTTTYTYDGANELETSKDFSGTTSYTYDGAGNQTRSQTPANSVVTNVWDDAGLRTNVILPFNIVSTSVYNGDGQRVRSKHGTGGTINYVWNQDDLLAETDSSDVTQILYTRAPDLGLNSLKQSIVDYFHSDGFASTANLTNSAETVQNTLDYSTCGKPIRHDSDSDLLFGFLGDLGYIYDWALEQYHDSRKVYDPQKPGSLDGTVAFASTDTSAIIAMAAMCWADCWSEKECRNFFVGQQSKTLHDILVAAGVAKKSKPDRFVLVSDAHSTSKRALAALIAHPKRDQAAINAARKLVRSTGNDFKFFMYMKLHGCKCKQVRCRAELAKKVDWGKRAGAALAAAKVALFVSSIATKFAAAGMAIPIGGDPTLATAAIKPALEVIGGLATQRTFDEVGIAAAGGGINCRKSFKRGTDFHTAVDDNGNPKK